MKIAPFLPVILVGSLRRDFIITPQGSALEGNPGGHLFYAAVGLQFKEKQFGLVSRINAAYPNEILEKFQSAGIDTRGIKRVTEAIDDRFFIHYDANNEKDFAQPLAHFAAERLPLPKELLGYSYKTPAFRQLEQRGPETIVYRDIPEDYLDGMFIHFCPHDFLTHTLIPQNFRHHGIKRITLRANPDYMIPQFLSKISSLLIGLHVFFCDESDIVSLFSNSSVTRFEDRLRTLCDAGAESILVFRKDDVYFYDGRRDESLRLKFNFTRNWNRTGLKDAFTGGFVGAFAQTYQFPAALASGAAAASFVSESFDPMYALETIQTLFEARSRNMTDQVEKIQPPKEQRRWRPGSQSVADKSSRSA